MRAPSKRGRTHRYVGSGDRRTIEQRGRLTRQALEVSETQSEIGCTGFATAGRSAAIAEMHIMAQHGPGEVLPPC